ncbi:MAG: hypothetical protein EB015_16845, partial [Methylocystaceae bacterium]|nr:hypothetical protein [Methylocystaceae bacterium]
MYLSLAIIRFLESLPSAFAVGLLLVPLLCREDGARFKNIIAALAFFRAILGFVLLYLILRQIIPSEKPINAKLLAEFTLGTTVGWAWIVSQFLAFLFAGLCFIRLNISSRRLDFIALRIWDWNEVKRSWPMFSPQSDAELSSEPSGLST